MSLDIGSLVGYIKLDHKGVGQGINAAQADMRAGMTRLQGEAKTGGEKAGKAAGDGLTGSMKNSVRNLTGIVAGAFAVEKVVSGLNAAKDAASDLNETTSMASVIFGDNAKAMQAWAKDAPASLGLANEAALRLSASFADMFQQIGFGASQATDMSKNVLQMAADLGSFKNLETDDVLERISAGFRGEYDSLQLLIPNISAARVQTEALAASGKKHAEDLTAQEKATATLAIVQKDGARAMGDFARTADGAANAGKTAAAMTDDLVAKVGQGLLPAYIALVTFGRDQLIPFLSETVDNMGAAADAAAPVADGIGDVVAMFRDLPGPLQTATLALIGFVAMRTKVEAMGTGLRTTVTKGASGASSALDSLKLHMMYAGDAAGTSSTKFTGAAKAIGYSAGVGLRGAATGLLGVLGGPWGLAFAGAVAAVTLFVTKQAEAKRFSDELKDSLDAQTGAVTENTKQKIAARLQDEGWLERARELGISIQTVTDAAAGNTTAMDTLRKAYESAQAEASRVRDGSDKLGQGLLTGASGASAFAQALDTSEVSTQAHADALKNLLDFVNPINSAMSTQQAKTREVADAAGVATDATDDLGTAAASTTDDLKDQEDAAKKVAQAVLDLADAQLTASGAQITYQDALASVEDRLAKRKELEKELRTAGGDSKRTQSLAEDLKGEKDPERRKQLEKDLAKSRAEDAKKQTEDQARIRKELDEYRLTLDLTTKAGRDNQKALNDQADAAKDQAEANLTAGGSIGEVRKQMADSRADFIDNAMRFGASRKAAEEMADEFGLTKTQVDNIAKAVGDLPASKQIQIEVSTAKAAADLAALQAKVSGLKDGRVSVVVDEVHGTRLVNAGTLANGGRGTAGGLTINADGGFYGGGARMFGANEGIKHVFNEPEAGGESFVPHALAKRGPATKVLQQTADLFGLSLQPKSESRSYRTTILHRGNIVASDPGAYADAMRQQQRRDNARGY